MERQIILDTETTGLDPNKGHRITEIGCLEMVNRRLTGRQFHTYLNPGRELDAAAAEISGLTFDFLKDKPKFFDIVEEFLVFVENAELIIHNAPFDMGFLNNELKLLRHPVKTLSSTVRVFDTLALARQLHPGQKNNLDALCKRYGIDNSHRVFHGALLDSEILSKVYLHMTAGQTHFALNTDTEVQHRSVKTNTQRSKLKRQTLNLTVIRASEEECELHNQRMAELAQA
jgi:DNA polymerase-3 subunit epsilon